MIIHITKQENSNRPEKCDLIYCMDGSNKNANPPILPGSCRKESKQKKFSKIQLKLKNKKEYMARRL